MKSLSPLPYPVRFVVRYAERWTELFATPEQMLDPDEIHGRFKGNEDCWIVMTYLRLRQQNLNVSISNQLVPGAICVVSGLDLAVSHRPDQSFVVACRSDGHVPVLADLRIVQTEAMLNTPKDIFIHHWSQPGLMPRLPERGNQIQTIVFKGWEGNLYEPFRSKAFIQELEQLGVAFQLDGLPEVGLARWHDYREADLVLAIRNLSELDALGKPASKLVNAWKAGVPALLGPEPAFRALRRSADLDYIEIKTPQDALSAIRRLKANPQLYEAMVANGLQRAEAFSVEQQCDRWHQVLSNEVAQHYRQWQKMPKLLRLARLVSRTIRHKRSMQTALYHRQQGLGILSGKGI
jgi:hypothetical protein